MSGAEERSLLRRWRIHRDRRALARLVGSYGERLERIADTFASHDVAQEDLVQEGVVGLLTAIARFDVERGGRLADYATSWVKMQMVRFVLASLTPVRIAERRLSAAVSLAGACRSLDDKRSQRALGPLADPSPNAEERLARVEEECAREQSLQARLARLTAEERAAIGALHFGEPRHAAAGAAAELAWNGLAKLLVEPGEPVSEVRVLVGGRRRRLKLDRGARRHAAAAARGG